MNIKDITLFKESVEVMQTVVYNNADIRIIIDQSALLIMTDKGDKLCQEEVM